VFDQAGPDPMIETGVFLGRSDCVGNMAAISSEQPRRPERPTSVDFHAIRRLAAVWVLWAAALSAQQAPIPRADELSGRPYAIKNKWVIGGAGTWDYLTVDPAAGQLFVTHQAEVQVVDLVSGLVTGRITGLGDARSIVLDPDGQTGYVSDSGNHDNDHTGYFSDSGNHDIKVFNRRSLRIETSIPLTCAPRSITLPAQHGILIAVCGSAVPAPPVESRKPAVVRSGRGRAAPRSPAKGDSWIAVIDTDARAVLVYLLVEGDFHIAQPDRDGNVYVTTGPAQSDRDRFFGTFTNHVSNQSIARIDVPALVEDARLTIAQRGNPAPSPAFPAPHWDSEEDSRSRYVTRFPLDASCPSPQGLAIDSQNARLFIACDNQAMLVMDSKRGQVLNTLTIGPGTDAIAYDDNRGVIFTANGGGYGSVTIIRQHLNDTYTVVQNLPTLEQARTMAIDPSTGLVYLVAALSGADLRNPPRNGIGTLKMSPVDGSFQVLVIGN
jgi:DNA-binding beta-propeller fold protein YncE